MLISQLPCIFSSSHTTYGLHLRSFSSDVQLRMAVGLCGGLWTLLKRQKMEVVHTNLLKSKIKNLLMFSLAWSECQNITPELHKIQLFRTVSFEV